MALNPPSFSDAPNPSAVVDAVTDAGEAAGEVAETVVDTVVDAVSDAVPDGAPPAPDGMPGRMDPPDFTLSTPVDLPLGDRFEDVASSVELPDVEPAVTEVVEAVLDTQIRPDVGGSVRLTEHDDGSSELDIEGRLGVSVNDDGVGVTTELHDHEDADGNVVIDGDTGGFVDVAGHHNEAGVTSADQSSEGAGTRDITLGGYAEHDDDRVEGGVFVTNDNDVSPFDEALSEGTGGLVDHSTLKVVEDGFYVSHNDDEVRVGESTDNGEAGEVSRSGVFVQDAEGDRTGVGVIDPGKITGDTFEVGTGGVYVDVDGERHDVHSEGGIVMADGEVELEGESDLGPVEVSGRVGIVTEGDDIGTPYARGDSEVEPNRLVDRVNDAAGDGLDVAEEEIGDAVGSAPSVDDFDDLGLDLPVLRGPDPTTEGDDSTEDDADGDGSILDALDPPVVVHDGLGDPLEDFHDSAMASIDAAGGLVDPTASTDDGNGVFENVTDAFGEAVDAVGDALDDLVEELFD